MLVQPVGGQKTVYKLTSKSWLLIAGAFLFVMPGAFADCPTSPPPPAGDVSMCLTSRGD